MVLKLEKTLQKIFSKYDGLVIRSDSWKNFLKDGVPTKKLEAWRYSDLTLLYQKYLIASVKLKLNNTRNSLLDKLELTEGYYNIIFIDGILVYVDQNPSVLVIKTVPIFEPHRRIKHPTMLLAQATTIAGLHLRIKENTFIDKPIQISYIHSDTCNHKVVNYQNIIELLPKSRCQVHERFISTSDKYSAVNINTKVDLAENSHYCYDFLSNKLQEKLLLTNIIAARLDKYTKFETFQLSGNSTLTRFDIIVDLLGQEAMFNASGICTVTERSHSDCHFYVNHLASNTSSKIDFKAIVSGKSTMVFNAKGYIKKGLKNVQVLQNNRNIQLTSNAKINTKPELEIYSDDVICRHSTTVGNLDSAALTYLQTRGISYKKAVELVLDSFAREIIIELPKPSQIIKRYLKVLQKELLSLEYLV